MPSFYRRFSFYGFFLAAIFVRLAVFLIRPFRVLALLSFTTFRAILRAIVLVIRRASIEPVGIAGIGLVGTIGSILYNAGFNYRVEV